jgi:hypothetical protein
MKAICFLLLLGSAITITGAKPPASVPSCANDGSMTCTAYAQYWYDKCRLVWGLTDKSCQWTSHQAYLECAHHGYCSF